VINEERFDKILDKLIQDMSDMNSDQRESLINNLPWCPHCWSEYSLGRNCQCWNDE
jgi:hypothetical protein